MNYETEILTILREAGQQGMPVRRIARNVVNMTNTFFMQQTVEDVYDDVAAYLRLKSSQKGAEIEKAETRGWYRLNVNSKQVQQLLLDFTMREEDEWMM